MSVVHNILKLRCPRCRQGKLFVSDNPYNFANLGKMYPNCPVCGQDFKIEIGFYWGALYIAYGISVFTSLMQFLLYYLLFDLSVNNALLLLIVIQLLLSPYLYRLSKSLWIHMFVSYRPEKAHS